MNRLDKLKKLAQSQSTKDIKVTSGIEPFIEVHESLIKKVDELKQSFSDGVNLNDADSLLAELQEIGSLREPIEKLKDKIAEFKLPENVEVKGLEDFLRVAEAISKKEIIVETVDVKAFDGVNKRLDKLIVKIETLKVPEKGQKPEDYVPTRRVMLVGKKLLFDDSHHTGGGGGSSTPTINGAVPVVNPDGSNISGGGGGGGDASAANQTSGAQKTQIVDAGGDAVTVTGGKLDVNASVDTTGLATSAKQDTQQTALDAIKTAVEVLDNVVSGSEAQVDIVGALPAGNNNIGDVDVASSALPTGASTSAKQDTGNTSLSGINTDTTAIAASASVLDDWDESDRAKTNPIVGQAGVQGASGVVSANTQRVVLATDVALPAGNNNIGDVDVASSALPTGASTSAKQDTVIGHLDGVEGLLTTIDGDTGTLAGAVSGSEMQVDVVTSALPSGAATSAKQDTLQTATDAIKTAVEVLDNAISGSEMQVDVVGALPAGNNNVGDVDVASVAAGTNLIGDVGIQPRTTNGLDTFMASGSDGSSILVATAQAVKGSAGKLYGYYAYNPEATVTFVHFYDTASGSVTVGTTNPLFTLQIPPLSAANLMSEIGITFGTAIAVAATTTAGGNTAPATGVSLTAWYK